MTTTARVASTKAADISYTASIAAGSVGNFIAIGDMKDGEEIVFEGSNGAGSIYEPLTYVDGGGNHRKASINRQNRTILIQGPVDFRINKSATASAVEVAQYT
jgi:hypothetical protein